MKILLTTISLIIAANSAFAAETVGEKVGAKANDIKRSAKHAVNKGDETICDKTDKNCFAKKVDHRTNETKDFVKDKTKEGKNIINNE